MFKRRRSEEDESAVEGELDSVDTGEFDIEERTDDDLDLGNSDGADGAGGVDEGAPLTRRDNGPFDIAEIDDGIERIDLGALRVTPGAGVDVRLDVDEETGVVQAVTFVVDDTVLQVGVFAAPRSEGIWADVRTQIAASITAGGGTVDQVAGEFGPELKAKVAGEDKDAKQMLQPVRFVGVDGPRWFLRGLLSGPGAERADLAAPLFDTFRSLVVVRGNDPMAPHEPLPISLPREPGDDDAPPEAAGHDLNPFRRGPEITEIR